MKCLFEDRTSGSKIWEVNALIWSVFNCLIKGGLKIKVIIPRWLKWWQIGLCLKQNKWQNILTLNILKVQGKSIIRFNIQDSLVFNDFSMGKNLQTYLLAPKNTQFGLQYTLMYGLLSTQRSMPQWNGMFLQKWVGKITKILLSWIEEKVLLNMLFEAINK